MLLLAGAGLLLGLLLVWMGRPARKHHERGCEVCAHRHP